MAKDFGPHDRRARAVDVQLRVMFDTMARRPTPHRLLSLVEQLGAGADHAIVLASNQPRRLIA